MQIGNIVKGHVNEVLGKNEDLYEERMAICKECPLYSLELGGLCNPRLYLNPKTGDVSTHYKDGYKNGCGCRLKAKTRVPSAHCPNNKW